MHTLGASSWGQAIESLSLGVLAAIENQAESALLGVLLTGVWVYGPRRSPWPLGRPACSSR